MISAYERLHAAGLAHSAEAWEGECTGRWVVWCFFGGLFSSANPCLRVSQMRRRWPWSAWRKASSIDGFALIDCQVTTDHLMQFGAREIPRSQFLQELQLALKQPTRQGGWRFAEGGGIGLVSNRMDADV